MRNFHWFRVAVCVSVCLGFTGTHVVWGDPTPVDGLVPTPHPNADFGTSVRAGTSVGFIYGAPEDVLAVGFTTAIGQRFGRLGLEAEYSFLEFESHGTVMTAFGPEDSDVSIGHGQRLALLARYDLLRFGPTVDQRRSLVTFYVEGGVAKAWNHWSGPSAADPGRLIPDDTRRTEGQAGFGIMIFPHRVAWLLGWRFAFSPHEPMTGSVCRGTSCQSVVMTDSSQYVDDSMLFQSSLEFTF